MEDTKEDVAGLLKLAAEPLVISRLGADGCGSRWREQRHRWFQRQRALFSSSFARVSANIFSVVMFT
jgi:hypothetical protein